MVSHLFLGECQWRMCRSKAKPAWAQPGWLWAKWPTPGFLGCSDVIFWQDQQQPLLSNGAGAACLQELPAKKWKRPYLVHPEQQLQAREITVPQLAYGPQYQWHRSPESMGSARVDQNVTTIVQCPAGRIKQLFPLFCLPWPVLRPLLPCSSPQFPCSQCAEDLRVFGSCGASAHMASETPSGGQLSMLW